MSSRKTITDEVKSISVFALNKQGLFDLSYSSEWLVDTCKTERKVNGIRVTISIDTETGEKTLLLANEYCDNQVIGLVTTLCNYGGERYWFLCSTCFKRTGVLYEQCDLFACRKCLKLGYATQYENRKRYPTIQEIIRIRRKIEQITPTIKRECYAGESTKAIKKLLQLKEREQKLDRAILGDKGL